MIEVALMAFPTISFSGIDKSDQPMPIANVLTSVIKENADEPRHGHQA
jgi:hypothetical protein